MKLHTGDTVVIIAGKDKGKTGSIMRVLESAGRVVVTGANMRTKHIKKTYQQEGRILRFEASLHVSNVMLIDPKTKKRSRIGYKMDEKGNKNRISKGSGEIVVAVKPVKKPASARRSKSTAEEATAGKAPHPDTEQQQKKQPFWRKKGGHVDAAETNEGSRMEQDHTIPDQQIHVRKGGRAT